MEVEHITHASIMQVSFKYEVCESSSVMYPKPVLTPAQMQEIDERMQEPTAYKEDPLWFCALCHQPVLDERGKQKCARSFHVAANRSGAQKEPANWYHCDPCRKAAPVDKRALALKTSAVGTPCIDKVLPVGGGSLW